MRRAFERIRRHGPLLLSLALILPLVATCGSLLGNGRDAGSWERVRGPLSVAVRSLLWEPSAGRLFIGSAVGPDAVGLGIYSPPEGPWRGAPEDLPTGQAFIDLASVGDEVWALHFSTGTKPGGILAFRGQDFAASRSIVVPEPSDPRCLVQLRPEGEELLLGCVTQGLLRSEDGGATWEPSSQGMENDRIQCLAVDPRDSSRVFAGTINGLYVSASMGMDWRRLRLGLATDGELVVDLVASVHEPGGLLAIVRDDQGAAHLLKSQDQGATWGPIMEGLPLDVQPRVVIEHPNEAGKLFLGTIFDGIYRSEDGGTTWSTLNGGLPLSESAIIVHSLALEPGEPDRLYAGTDLEGSLWGTPL